MMKGPPLLGGRTLSEGYGLVGILPLDLPVHGLFLARRSKPSADSEGDVAASRAKATVR